MIHIYIVYCTVLSPDIVVWDDCLCLMITSCCFWCHCIPRPTAVTSLTEGVDTLQCHYYLHVKISFSAHNPGLSQGWTGNRLQDGGSWCCCSGAARGGPCFCCIPGYTLFCFGSCWDGLEIASSLCYVIKRPGHSHVQAEHYNMIDGEKKIQMWKSCTTITTNKWNCNESKKPPQSRQL